GNRPYLPWRLWASFFYLLRSRGVDDVETDDQAPPGFVQVMTIHQSKGLEFPVVIVGSLDRTPRSGKELDRRLAPFYPRGRFEPEGRITEFDCRREFYVALSRTKHLLVIYSEQKAYRFFDGLTARAASLDTVDLSKLPDVLPIDS